MSLRVDYDERARPRSLALSSALDHVDDGKAPEAGLLAPDLGIGPPATAGPGHSWRPANATGSRDSLVPVRRAFPAQALVIVRLGSLAPADAGLFLALLRQHRLVIWVRSHNPIISAAPAPAATGYVAAGWIARTFATKASVSSTAASR